jgi:hypothetical protein
MIRFLRVDRQLSSWRILKDIIITHRQELTVTLVIAFMFLITGSYLVYIAETPIDPSLNSGPFRSMADAMWFSIITVIHSQRMILFAAIFKIKKCKENAEENF